MKRCKQIRDKKKQQKKKIVTTWYPDEIRFDAEAFEELIERIREQPLYPNRNGRIYAVGEPFNYEYRYLNGIGQEVEDLDEEN